MKTIWCKCGPKMTGVRKSVLVMTALTFLFMVWVLNSMVVISDDPRRDDELLPLTRIKPVIVESASENYHSDVGFPELNGSDCNAAFNSKAKNDDFLKRRVARIPNEQISDDAYKGCEDFRRRYGFMRHPQPSEEEKDFPLAFIILLHKDLDQVMYLLRAIYHPHNTYCLSVDMNSGSKFLEYVRSAIRCIPNVFVATKLERIVYSGFSRLQADVNCMQDLMTSPLPWRYVINMAGQQFPIRTNLEMVRILKIFNGSNDVEGIGGSRMLTSRYKFQHKYVVDKDTGVTSIVRTSEENPPPPHGLEIVKGSAYGSFSRAFVNFVVNNQTAKDFLEWCKAVNSPDEYFWATLHHSKTVPVPGRYTGPLESKKWFTAFASWGGENTCATIRVRAICIFSPEDLPLLARRPELFANKFYITHHPGSLHCLDQFLYNMTKSGIVRDMTFYKKQAFLNGTLMIS